MSRKTVTDKYNYSEKGKLARAKYNSSPKGKASRAIAMDKYRKKNRNKRRAQSAVAHAIASGKIQTGECCEYCGNNNRMQAHHPSYSKEMWLCIVWLCESCHVSIHRPRGA